MKPRKQRVLMMNGKFTTERLVVYWPIIFYLQTLLLYDIAKVFAKGEKGVLRAGYAMKQS